MPTHEFAGPEDRIHKIRAAKMWDQHGRRFAVVLDKRNGAPIGAGPRPDGWKAPWMPGQEWFRYDEEDPRQFRIDYEGMLNDRIAAHEQYEREWDDFAGANGWDPKDKDYIGRIIAKVGPRPLPVELIVAAMQGNKYILGLTDVVDERIVPFLRMKPKYQRTAKKEARLAGMDFSDHDADADLEERMDIEEAFDKDETPRGRVPVKTAKTPRNKKPTLPEAA